MYKNRKLSFLISLLIMMVMFFNMTAYAINVESVSLRPSDSEPRLEAKDGQDPAEKLDKIIEDALKYNPLTNLDFNKDKNIIEVLDRKIRDKGYEGVEIALVEVERNDEYASIDEDGTINYYYEDPNEIFYSKVIQRPCSFELSLDGAKRIYKTNATFSWDHDKVESLIREEIFPLLEEANIKGENESLGAVEKDLILPKRPKKYVEVSWTSNDRNLVISNELQMGSSENINKPYLGKVRQERKAKKVGLTAHITFNHIGKNFLSQETFFVEKDIDLIIKGSEKAPSLEEVEKEFKEKYVEEIFKTSTSGERVDFNNITGDIALPAPRATGIKDASDYKFTATSDSENISINGYRLSVIRPLPGEDPVEASLKVTMEGKNSSLKVSKDFKLRILALTDEEIDREVSLMERAKANYFDAIRGENEKQDEILENLHAFHEINLADGELNYVYGFRNQKNIGIYPDDMAQTSDMNAPGYQEAWNKFKSSKPNVIQHENLVLHRPEYDERVTIESKLSSREYGKYAKLYPENEKLQKLYRQDVSVELTVKGKKEGENPNKEPLDKGLGKYIVRIEGRDSTLVPRMELEVDDLSLEEIGTTQEFTSVKPIHVITKALKEATSIDIKDPSQYDHGNGSYINRIGSLGTAGNSGWMYRVNNKYANDMVDKYKIVPGDEIVLYYLENWEDNKYAYFEKDEAEVKLGQTIKLKLLSEYYNMETEKNERGVLNSANILINNKLSNIKTDENGEFEISFDRPGDYILSAKRTNAAGQINISRPYMKISVGEDSELDRPKESGLEIEYLGSKEAQAGSEFRSELLIKNKQDRDQDLYLILGLYRQDVLVNYSRLSRVLGPGQETKLGAGFLVPREEDLSIRLFLWDNEDRQNILMEEVKEIEVR